MSDRPPAPSPTPPAGLTAAEVARRVARGEVNRIPRSRLAEYAEIFSRNLFTLFNALVVPAAIALFLLDEDKGGIAVTGMALTNTLLGLVQEVRARWHLDRLSLLTEARVHVVRDGSAREILSGELVTDDLVLLRAGEPILADGTVAEERGLEVDEALLTGESDPVPRGPGDRLLSGSICVAGEGSYRIEKVGAESFAQQLAREARSYHYTTSPIQQTINRLLRVLTALAIALCGLYLVLARVRGLPAEDVVKMIAATVTSMIPQGLVLMSTMAFILGAVRMSRKGAIAQQLTAVETMAAVDTLCLDKTGTLTTSRLHLEWVAPVGDAVGDAEVRLLLARFACAAADQNSKTIQALRASLPAEPAEVVDQLPFKSQNRYSAVRLRGRPADAVLALGGPEAIEPFFAPASAAWQARWKEQLGSGLRLLLFARGSEPPAAAPFNGSLGGHTLEPLALVAFGDEVRPEAAPVLEELAGQGISFKVISGDHPETVRATLVPLARASSAPAIRALAEQAVVTGDQLEQAGDPAGLILGASVFGRVSPWQKLAIVKELKRQGKIVAMVGDGVNDVLPIKNAHLGIAMGEGSRASKTVAGLVLENNSFELLPQTLEEGRTILRSLRRASKLFLVKNAYMLLLIVAALGVLGLPFPFEPQQVTLLNLLTIGLPAVLITLSRDGAVPVRRVSFLREVGGFAFWTGLVVGLADLLLFWLAARVWGYEVPMQRALLLTATVLMGLLTLYRILQDDGGSTSPDDRRILALIALGTPVYLAAMYWPLAASFFAIRPLEVRHWLQVLAVTVPAAALLLGANLRRRRRDQRSVIRDQSSVSEPSSERGASAP